MRRMLLTMIGITAGCSALFAADAAVRSPHGRYHMASLWPNGHFEQLSGMDDSDLPTCTLLLRQLNAGGVASPIYSDSSFPRWMPPITVSEWHVPSNEEGKRLLAAALRIDTFLKRSLTSDISYAVDYIDIDTHVDKLPGIGKVASARIIRIGLFRKGSPIRENYFSIELNGDPDSLLYIYTDAGFYKAQFIKISGIDYIFYMTGRGADNYFRKLKRIQPQARIHGLFGKWDGTKLTEVMTSEICVFNYF